MMLLYVVNYIIRLTVAFLKVHQKENAIYSMELPSAGHVTKHFVMTEEKKGIYAVTTVALVKLKKSRPICFIISVWKRYRKNFLNKIFLLHSIVCLLIV